MPFPLIHYIAQTPGDLLAGLVVIAFVALAALAMGIAVARRLGMGLATAIAAAFAVSVALASAIMLVGGWLGLSLFTGAVVYLAAGVGLSAWALWLMRGAPAISADRPALALGGVAVLCALIQRPWFKVSADTFYHVAAARSLIVRDALVVTDPFHGTAITVADPSSGVLHTMMAMAARLTGLDMASLFSGWTILGGVLLAVAFYALVKRISGSERVAAITATAYLVANQFLDFRAMGYPNRISMALVFFGLLMLIEVYDRPSWTAAVLAAAAGVGVSAIHVGNGEFFFIAAIALAFWAVVDALVGRWREGRWSLANTGALVAAVVATGLLALPFVLPKFGVVSD